MANWGNIRNEWETTNITLKALAGNHDVKLGTLKSRKSREGWSRDPTEKDATIQNDASEKSDKVATPKNKPRYKEGSRKGTGNPSPVKQFTERNSAAKKHGLFSRYIPQGTLEIMGMLDKSDPADLVWDQIQIQYAAIIRAQQIMYVEDQYDMTKELKKKQESDFGSLKEHEIQFAWDKHASFLNAQSRAMAELRSSIKQFNDMAHEYDERRLKLEQMQVNIEKTKAEVTRLSGDTVDDYEDDGFIEALGDTVEVWNDDDNGSTEET